MTGRWGRATARTSELQATLRARMARTRVVAAATALALLPVSVLAGAIAAPAEASTPASTTVLPASSTADSPDDITWDDVAAAQASVEATQALVTQITSQLASLQAQVKAAQADADAKGEAYGKAEDAYDAQNYIVQNLQKQADAAQKEADTAKKTAGQLLAQVAKTSGADGITASLLGNSGQADQLLARFGYMNQISDRSKQVYAKALQLQKSATALTDQANAAKAVLAKLKDAAQAAFEVAQAAAQKASDALKSAQTQAADLEDKLSHLKGDYQSKLTEYNATLVAKWGPGAAGVVSASGWANPANGYLGDRFGMRFHPIYHVWKLHTGQDISGTGCGAPIYAAHSGTVTYAGRNGDLGNFIQIDDGDGTSTGYGHIIDGGILVSIGQHVGPGQNIAKVGSTGGSTGCHLHFMVRINGALTDPLPFMRDRGITLGS
jgi:murein DD-endopeptidase MepM/ murein hydrolase activator NlpD